jgi:hypothetical protein
MSDVRDEINKIENKLDCNNTINVLCDKIDSMNDIVVQINITSTFIQEYLTTLITQYLANISNQTSGAGEFLFKGVPEIDLLVDGVDGDVTRSGGIVQFDVELTRQALSSFT